MKRFLFMMLAFIFFAAPVAHASAVSPDKAMKPDNESWQNIDLRYVDWDNMKTRTTLKLVRQGDEEEENGNGDKGDDNGDEDKKDEGKSGWDRIWDATKLG